MPQSQDPLLRGWEVTLRAEGYPHTTIATYTKNVRYFSQWLSRPLCEATKHDVRSYIATERERLKPTTLTSRVGCLKVFYDWAVAEGDIDRNPLDGVKVPKAAIPPVDILTPEQMKALLKVCDSKRFIDIRDRAIMMVLMDTGLRIGELVDIKVDDVDILNGTIVVRGKGASRLGKRTRTVAMGSKTAQILSRYIRARALHRHHAREELWLSQRGALSVTQCRHQIQQRAKATGIIDHLHPHMLRHSWAHYFRENGGNDTDLMVLGGWSNPMQIAKRYGAAGAVQRAHTAAKRYSIGDKL